MRILGIDPGTGRMGFGAIDCVGSKMTMVEYGCIETPAHMETSERLVIIFNKVKEIISRTKPDAVAVEKLFFAKNVTTVMSVGEARGVAVLAIALAGAKFAEFTPLQVKQAVTGYGRADKTQIQNMVKAILSLDKIPKPDDAADALAIAITCSTMNNSLLTSQNNK